MISKRWCEVNGTLGNHVNTKGHYFELYFLNLVSVLSPPQSLLKFLQITYMTFPEYKWARAVWLEDWNEAEKALPHIATKYGFWTKPVIWPFFKLEIGANGQKKILILDSFQQTQVLLKRKVENMFQPSKVNIEPNSKRLYKTPYWLH